MTDSCNIKEFIEIKKIIKRADSPGFNYIIAIRSAAYHGYIIIIKLLLQHSGYDPSCYYNDAIRIAYNRNHLKIVELLLNDQRVVNNIHLIKYKKVRSGLEKMINIKKLYLYSKYGIKLLKFYRKLQLKWSEPGEFYYLQANKDFDYLKRY